MAINVAFTEELNERRLEPPDPDTTVYVEAGPITFALEYRFMYQKDAEGRLTDEVNDHGLSIHVLEGRGDKPKEHLRFDCFQIRPHYHYVNWPLVKQQHMWFDTAGCGDIFQWTIERFKTRLPHMLIAAGAEDLASQLDQGEIDAALPKVIAWADALRERAHINWRGRLYLTGAGIYPAQAGARNPR